MSKTDHLARAKDYRARGDDYHAKAGEEIQAWLDELASRTVAQAASDLGWGESTVYRLLALARDRKCDGEITQPNWGSGSNKRDEVAQRVLRDPVQRRQVIESLTPGERAEVALEVARSTTPPSTDTTREGEGEVFRSIEDAPNRDLSALAARLVATASRIEVELVEGAEFKRMTAKDLQRLDRDLERVKDTADRLKEQITAQSRVRRIA